MLTQPLVSVRGRYRAVIVLVLIAVAVGLVSTTRTADLEAQRVTVAQPLPYHPAFASLDSSSIDTVPLDGHRPPRAFTLERGQTMASLLMNLGIEAERVPSALRALAEHLDLRRVRAGASGLAVYDHAGGFHGLRMELSGRGWRRLEQLDDG
ncbi:MAG: hypothetical protein AAGE94_25795, partial [Acidobacteriota bacterium]